MVTIFVDGSVRKSPKNTDFVEDSEYLLPVKFCQVPLGYREE